MHALRNRTTTPGSPRVNQVRAIIALRPSIFHAVCLFVLSVFVTAGCASTRLDRGPGGGATTPRTVEQASAGAGPEQAEGGPIRFDGGRVPVFPEKVLVRGLIVAKVADRLTFFDHRGRRLAATIQGSALPAEIMGFSPDRGRLFYIERAVWSTDEARPAHPRPRVLDFRRGTDEVVLDVPNYAPRVIAFSPSAKRLYMQMISHEWAPERPFIGGGEARDLREVEVHHPTIQACDSFMHNFSFNPAETKIYFETCYNRNRGLVRPGDEFFVMGADGKDARAVSLKMPGFLCTRPLHSPASSRVAVTCWKIDDEAPTPNVYLATLDERDQVLGVKRLTDVKRGQENAYPALWSADGRHLVVAVEKMSARGPLADIVLIDLKRGRGRRFAAADGKGFLWWRMTWDGSRRLAVFAQEFEPGRNGSLRLLHLDLRAGRRDVVLSGVDGVWTAPHRVVTQLER